MNRIVFLSVMSGMKLIKRGQIELIRKKIGKGKAIVVVGPRQTGKTTLVQSLLKGKEYLFLDGDDPAVRERLVNASTEQIKSVLGAHDLVFIDEAQRFHNMGITAKIITDQFKDVQLILSGSSAFDINESVSESLTGRTWPFMLYPITWQEFESHVGLIKAESQLPQRLVYGMYPDVFNHPGEEEDILTNLTGGYMYKDILAHSGIRKSELLDKLVRALALQVGQEVSYNEVAQLIGTDKNTVAKYVELLEKAFIIHRLTPFSRNIRNEIKRNQKIYFWDNGIRNAVIGNWDPPSMRTDLGALWENFLISERKKHLSYSKSWARSYFWRTTQQQEVDYVEEKGDKLQAWEFKWSPTVKVKTPKTFVRAYDIEAAGVNRENFREFLMP